MKSRNQQFLDAIEAGDPLLLPSPITREERFLHALSTGEEITPTTYEEQFMQAARAFKGSDSTPTEPEPIGPLGKRRSEFAIASNYTETVKATQVQNDSFIDTVHLGKRFFYLFSLDNVYIYIFTTGGTGLVIDESTRKITSNETIFSLETGGGNRDRGLVVDWSSQPGPLKLLETYTR